MIALALQYYIIFVVVVLYLEQLLARILYLGDSMRSFVGVLSYNMCVLIFLLQTCAHNHMHAEASLLLLPGNNRQ